MTLNVLIQIALLSESKLAILLNSVRAGVGPLISVNTQVIVEVVPLPEVHGAVWEIAL
jgi:antitoxin (DNA-binding transcriptional repressor) of toxin-antitoxin stability system